MTYSIIARDPATGDMGVAAQSHFFAAGGLVCWAEPGVGAIASQAFADSGYGALGLELMHRGVGAGRSLAALVAIDDLERFRQVAMVDVSGSTTAHTGANCIPHAGHAEAPGVSAQGNMLRSAGTWQRMVDAYNEADGDLAERLLVSLEAAEAAGGDIRGRQAAGIRIVSGTRPARPWEGMILDLRVEDHPEPVAELRRLVTFKRAFDLVANVIFAEGLILGAFDEMVPGSVDTAVAGLVAAALELGHNAEPDLWRTVLLARARRDQEAEKAMAIALEKNPNLADFFRRLPAAGFLDTDNPLLALLQ